MTGVAALIALVLLEAAAIGLLGLLVAGLLRSHAEILRRLHQLGAGLDVGSEAARPQPRPRRPAAVPAIDGETPSGDAARVALDRPGERTLVLFLSSGCGTCAPWWAGLRSGAHRHALPGVRVVVTARDAAEESPSLLAGLAPPDVTVVLSSGAWEAFGVPGSPYAVLVQDGAAVGQGVAHSWEQLGSLVARQLADGRERRADAELAAAGILPGDPSLYPEPGAWSRP